MHGVIMVFFFLIPSIPAVLGNFLIPLMIGAKDLAFPRLNLLSWYIYVRGRRCSRCARSSRAASTRAGPSTRRTARSFAQSNVIVDGGRHLHRRLLLDPDRAQLHRHHPQDAGARADLVPAAALRLGPLRDQRSSRSSARPVVAITHPAGGARAALPLRHLRPGPRRRPDPLPAPVLVLLAPGGLHHDPAGDGRDQRARHLLLAQADLRLQLHRHLEPGHRRPRLPRLGPPHVRLRPVGLRRPWSSRC